MKTLTTIFASLAFTCQLAMAQTFTLKSNSVGGQATQKEFANSFGCHGENISPQLSWENAPAGTQCFAVTIYDKDAPTGSGFWHWVIFNIPGDVKELKAGAGTLSKNLAPKDAIQSNNDGGMAGYMGPCPPPGAPHQYLVTVYALKEKLSLDKNATPPYVGYMLNAGSLGRASLVFYGQQ